MSSSRASVEVYELQNPIEFADKTITQVEIRKRSKMKDWRPFLDPTTGITRKIEFDDKNRIDQDGLGILAHRLCGMSALAWNEIDFEDGQQIIGRVAGFLSGSNSKETSSPTTEMTSSPSLPGDSASQSES